MKKKCDFDTLYCVRGNYVKFSIALQEVVTTVVDGEITTETNDYYPQSEDSVRLVLRNQSGGRSFYFSNESLEIDGNVLSVENNGTLPLGTYGIEIEVKEAVTEKRMRFFHRLFLEVVSDNCEAAIDGSTEFDSRTRNIDAKILYGVRGASAYEIWLKNGYIGTEQDFLSWLVGGAGQLASKADIDSPAFTGTPTAPTPTTTDGIANKDYVDTAIENLWQRWLDNNSTTP